MSVLGFAERIAGFHGSQCGFCTPGMVVACHTALSIAQSKGEKCTPMQMEKAFDGNLCRCTGYRPILDGCKVRWCMLVLLPCIYPFESWLTMQVEALHAMLPNFCDHSCTG